LLLVSCARKTAASPLKEANNPKLPPPQVIVVRATLAGFNEPVSPAHPEIAVVSKVTATPVDVGQSVIVQLAPTLSASPTAPQPIATLPGWPAAPFELPVINVPGVETISLESLKGKSTMLGYFTTWCTTCRTELPVVAKIYEQMKDQVQFVYINGGESEPVVSKFIQEMGVNFPVILDYNTSVSHAYRVQVLPTSFFIDSNGRIVNYYLGAMTEDVLLDRLSKIIDQ
jgi:thiol-disulfide isomerase/thioredoxin